ncbi:hypothetical protein [Nocardia sp. NPDC003963]
MDEMNEGLPDRIPHVTPARRCSQPALPQSQLSGNSGELQLLHTLVRAAAVASLSEAEFVRRIRRDGVAMWPHRRTVDGRVHGYAMELSIGLGRTYHDTDMAADLTLSHLREDWDDRRPARGRASAEWQGLRPYGDFDRDQVVLLHRSVWSRMFTDVGLFNQYLRELTPAEAARWSWAAARLAGVAGQWACRATGDPALGGALGKASRALGRSAVHHQCVGRAPADPVPSRLHRAAYGLAQFRPADLDPMRSSVLLLVQFIAGVVEISKAHRRRAEVSMSGQLDEVVAELGWHCRRLYVQCSQGVIDGSDLA